VAADLKVGQKLTSLVGCALGQAKEERLIQHAIAIKKFFIIPCSSLENKQLTGNFTRKKSWLQK